MSEIDYDPQISEARRERTERAVLSRVAAIQALGESDAVMAVSPPKYRWLALGFAGAAVAAAVLFFVMRGDSRVVSEPPSLVQTPVGGSSRFTVGESIIEAGGDTSVQVKREAGDVTTLVLARGSVDCQVESRAGRGPFRVVAGDVTVEVVGTRFSVRYVDGAVRVDVTHGKVRVKSKTEERVLEAGGSWTPSKLAATEPGAAHSAQAAAQKAPTESTQAAQAETAGPSESAEPKPVETEPEPIEMPEERAAAKTPGAPQSPRAAWKAAERLEATNPAEAARAYRLVANGKDTWASLALYSLAELHAAKEPASALRELDELAKRFPNNANAEDAAWLRVDVLRKLDRDDDARKAARTYLRDYPNGTYADKASRLATP